MSKRCQEVFRVDMCNDATCDQHIFHDYKNKQMYDRRPGESPLCNLHSVMKEVYKLTGFYDKEGVVALGEKIDDMGVKDLKIILRASLMALAEADNLPEIELPAEHSKKSASNAIPSISSNTKKKKGGPDKPISSMDVI